MTVPYPLATRTIIRSSKARSQPAAFRMAVPRRGARYAQAGGAGAPRVFSVTFRFTSAEAQAFQQWFVYDLDRGVLDFTMPIRTEAGVETLACRFAPGALLDAREVGEVWEYTATLIDVGYVAPPTDWPVLPEADVPAYPLGLRTIIRASKARSQPAAFTLSDPRAGYPYTQASGYDTPTVWSVEFRFTAAEAQTFQDWFRDDLQLGVLAFTMPIRTEFGVSDQTCRFLDDGLLDASEVGEIWSYRATIEARAVAVPPVPHPDPFIGNVRILLHFNGNAVDTGSAALSNSSSSVSYSLSPAQFDQSANFTASNSAAVTVAASALASVGTGDFTVEFWWYPTTLSSGIYFLAGESLAGGASIYFHVDGPSSLGFFFLGNAATRSATIAVNTWHHIAMSRSGTDGHVFVDGVELWAPTVSASQGTSVQWHIGSATPLAGAGTGGRCYIDDFRLTVGACRYTAGFARPSSEFPDP